MYALLEGTGLLLCQQALFATLIHSNICNTKLKYRNEYKKNELRLLFPKTNFEIRQPSKQKCIIRFNYFLTII